MKYFKQITLVAVLLTILINLAATALPLFGISTAAVSDKYLNYFTPAGYVFSIWGVIYLGWIAYAIYPYLAQKDVDKQSAAFPWFILSCVANSLWLFLWHSQQLGWSVVIMLVLLGSLIMTYLKLEIGVAKVPLRTKLMVHLPISIYLGWISVATIANISAALTQVKWSALGQSAILWTVLLMAAAAALAVLMLKKRNDYAYALVIIWALVGIAQKFSKTESIQTAVLVAIIGIILQGVLVSVDRLKK